MHTRTSLLFGVAVCVSSCVSPPNTPGAGAGAEYTPIIDMQGVDPGRYSSDLDACRGYARSVDVGAATINGAIEGAILGGLFSAALGGNHRTNMQSANASGLVAGTRQGERAVGKQERVVINCMAGRGYRPLDAAGVTVVSYPAGSAVPMNAGTALPVPVVTGPVERPGAFAPPPTTVGSDSYQAEHLEEVRSCAPRPLVTLIGRGPGFETYSAACSNGTFLTIRCEWGNCRVLK